MVDRVLVTFALGRNTGKFVASESGGSRAFSDALGEMSVEYARKNTNLDLKMITSRLKQTVETAYTDAVRYAARNMMGRTTTAAYGTDSNPIQTPRTTILIGGEYAAEWYPLSGRQIKKQRGNNPGQKTGKFFIDTGALKTELLSMARAMVKKTGVLKVQIKDHSTEEWRKPLSITKIVPVADLKLIMLPNVYPSQLPGIRSGQIDDYNIGMGFEKSLGLSEEAVRKLRGPVIPGQGDLYHRPLLQPVFSYWTLFRIPTVVQEALNRGLVGRGTTTT